MLEQVCPIMPSRDFAVTTAFYESLGFEAFPYKDEYLIVNREKIELHFYPAPQHDPASSLHGAYVRPKDVDAISAEWAAKQMPGKDSGVFPRFDAAEDKPWRMREATLWDPDGNLLRIGQAI